MQRIKLLISPTTDTECVLVERNPDWFADLDEGTDIPSDEAVLLTSFGDETLEELRLDLSVLVVEEEEGQPLTWHFELTHEKFPYVTLCEWSGEVPNEIIPEILIPSKHILELRARFGKLDQ